MDKGVFDSVKAREIKKALMMADVVTTESDRDFWLGHVSKLESMNEDGFIQYVFIQYESCLKYEIVEIEKWKE